MPTVAEVASVLGIDISSDSGKLEMKAGAFTLRREYYWRPKNTPEGSFERAANFLKDKYGERFSIVGYGDKHTSFKGGEGVKKNSHYWFKFKIKGA